MEFRLYDYGAMFGSCIMAIILLPIYLNVFGHPWGIIHLLSEMVVIIGMIVIHRYWWDKSIKPYNHR